MGQESLTVLSAQNKDIGVGSTADRVQLFQPFLDRMAYLEHLQQLTCTTIIERSVYHKMRSGGLAGECYQCWIWANVLEQLPILIWGVGCSQPGTSNFAEEISIRLINWLPITCSATPFSYISIFHNSCREGVIATKVPICTSHPWTNNCTKNNAIWFQHVSLPYNWVSNIVWSGIVAHTHIHSV